MMAIEAGSGTLLIAPTASRSKPPDSTLCQASKMGLPSESVNEPSPGMSTNRTKRMPARSTFPSVTSGSPCQIAQIEWRARERGMDSARLFTLVVLIPAKSRPNGA